MVTVDVFDTDGTVAHRYYGSWTATGDLRADMRKLARFALREL
jgi:hypothetical protein